MAKQNLSYVDLYGNFDLDLGFVDFQDQIIDNPALPCSAVSGYIVCGLNFIYIIHVYILGCGMLRTSHSNTVDQSIENQV